MRNNLEYVIRLWGTAARLRETIRAPMWPIERPDYARCIRVARAWLDEATFAGAWEAEQAMSLEQALAEALGEGG